MNINSESRDHRLLALLEAVRDTHDESARATLNELLRNDSNARAAMARLLVDEQALIHRLRDDSIVSLLSSTPSVRISKSVRSTRLQVWRLVASTAAGLLFGILGTSVVYGFVATRMSSVKRVPLAVHDPGLEKAKQTVVRGFPKAVGKWGADSAKVVTAEYGVQPLQGKRMLRLEPFPPEDQKNFASRAYQVFDVSSLPMLGIPGDAEVEVTASFAAAKNDVASRYLVRAFALNKTPEQATKTSWQNSEDVGVVSMTQRFETDPGDRGWHTFSIKMPLPQRAQTLVIVFGALPTDNESAESSAHYLDDVHVSVLTLQPTIP